MAKYLWLIAAAAASLMLQPGGGSAGPVEQIETTAERARVTGEVLRIEQDQYFTLKDPAGREVRVWIATDLNPGLKAGDRIEATINDKGDVLTLDKLDRTAPPQPNAAR